MKGTHPESLAGSTWYQANAVRMKLKVTRNRAVAVRNFWTRLIVGKRIVIDGYIVYFFLLYILLL